MIAWLPILAVSLFAARVSANHPVLVEGNCDSPVPGTTLVAPGTCGDFDGDGRIGTAEDTDGADRIFGTLNAALGPGTGAAAGTGANFNGLVMIVASGRYAQNLEIPSATFMGTPGNLTIEAAPGVEANIDAVLQGDPGGMNNTRQGLSGIAINYPGDRRVTLRNLAIRNFKTGIDVQGTSHVAIEGCRLENNLDFGINARNSSRVLVAKSSVRMTGFRVGSVMDPPAPGSGISFNETSSGAVSSTTISGNLAAGLENNTGSSTTVCAVQVTSFDNALNFANIDASATAAACQDVALTCPAAVCPAPTCPTPVVQGTIRTCKRCKTRGEVTTCTKCEIALQ
jgi:parallel beta-helix repeat protein